MELEEQLAKDVMSRSLLLQRFQWTYLDKPVNDSNFIPIREYVVSPYAFAICANHLSCLIEAVALGSIALSDPITIENKFVSLPEGKKTFRVDRTLGGSESEGLPLYIGTTEAIARGSSLLEDQIALEIMSVSSAKGNLLADTVLTSESGQGIDEVLVRAHKDSCLGRVEFGRVENSNPSQWVKGSAHKIFLELCFRVVPCISSFSTKPVK
jgi:hypothetical protein